MKIKEKKKLQLSLLLINKFRNKFTINKGTELQLDQIIKDEVSILINEEQMVERKLNQLDKKLEVIITDFRKNKKLPTPALEN